MIPEETKTELLRENAALRERVAELEMAFRKIRDMQARFVEYRSDCYLQMQEIARVVLATPGARPQQQTPPLRPATQAAVSESLKRLSEPPPQHKPDCAILAGITRMYGCTCGLHPPNASPGTEQSSPSDAQRRPDHAYTTHRTYTGAGCAICGLPESQHAQARSEGQGTA